MARKRVELVQEGAAIEEFYGCDGMEWKPGKVATVTEDGFVAESGVKYTMADLRSSWRFAAGPAEVAGVDVRTEPLALDAVNVMTAIATDAAEQASTGLFAHGPAGLPGTPSAEEQVSKLPPRPTLDVAIERYGNLDRDIQTYLTRLESWVVGDGWQAEFDAHVGELRVAWEWFGTRLAAMNAAGVVVKVTPRSRRDAWMRPGAEVSLNEAAFKRFLAHYPAAVLENLTIEVATERDVFLVSGERELGLVPKSQVIKRKAAAS